MPNNEQNQLSESQNPTTLSPSDAPAYQKCIDCPDLGLSCRGFDITCLSGIDEARAYHKAIRRSRGIQLKAVYKLAKQISESTINEYFGAGAKDYKWTTVTTIHGALLLLCGDRVDLPPLEDSCPVSSSEARRQLAAADLNMAAAELKIAQAESECDDLRRKLADCDGTHTAQLEQIQASKQSDIEWLRNDVRLWRRFAFILLGIGLVLLASLLFYIALDFLSPDSGFIRY